MSHVTHMNESCHTYRSSANDRAGQVSRVTQMHESCHTYKWVMSHIWMSHVTHMDESFTHMNESCHTYGWVMSHIWMSHVTHTAVLPTTQQDEWIMSRAWMRHITHMNETCHTHEWVMSHTWTSHITHMNGSCHTYERVMSHTWMIHITHINESCHTYEWVMSHIWMSHVTHTAVLPTTEQDEFKPFVRKLPEFKFWHSVTRVCCSVCSSVLQCVAVNSSCGTLLSVWVAACCSMLRHFAACWTCVCQCVCVSVCVCVLHVHPSRVLQCRVLSAVVRVLHCVALCCTVSRGGAVCWVCCRVLLYVAVPCAECWRTCVAVCCSVLQCVAVCCSVLLCVAVCLVRCTVLHDLGYVAACCSAFLFRLLSVADGKNSRLDIV